MTVALTGATGFVGHAVIAALLGAGHEVRALARKVQCPRPAGVEWIAGDLADKAALARLVAGAEAVIHVAGLTHALDLAQFDAANVAGTLALVEAAKKARVARFVFVSSLAAREPSLSAYGASKAKAERIVAASGLDWTIVRPPGVYGPRDVDFLQMFKLAKLGVVPVPPPGRSSLVHVDDLARLLVVLLPSSELVTGNTFEPDDGRAQGWSHRELAKAIGWAVGRHPWVPHLSAGTMRLASRAETLLRGTKARLTPDRVGYMVHPDWVSDPQRRVPPSLWQPRIATRDGLKATAAWYRGEGLL